MNCGSASQRSMLVSVNSHASGTKCQLQPGLWPPSPAASGPRIYRPRSPSARSSSSRAVASTSGSEVVATNETTSPSVVGSEKTNSGGPPQAALSRTNGTSRRHGATGTRRTLSGRADTNHRRSLCIGMFQTIQQKQPISPPGAPVPTCAVWRTDKNDARLESSATIHRRYPQDPTFHGHR